MGLPKEAGLEFNIKAEIDDLKSRMKSLEEVVKQVKSTGHLSTNSWFILAL